MKPIPSIISACVSSNILLATCALAMFRDRPAIAGVYGILGVFLLFFSVTPAPRSDK